MSYHVWVYVGRWEPDGWSSSELLLSWPELLAEVRRLRQAGVPGADICVSHAK